MASLEFWYDFSCPYSYFSMMRIEALAKDANVKIIYYPFLLGPIFKDFGWSVTPLHHTPEKKRYIYKDVKREAEYYGLDLDLPDVFPTYSLLAVRISILAFEQGWGLEFSKAVFMRHFTQGLPIFHDTDIMGVFGDMKKTDTKEIMASAKSPETKQALFQRTQKAQDLGIFGSPAFIVDNELFWGNDRLKQAILMAKTLTPKTSLRIIK